MMKLPKELQEKLVAAETDVQACKILVENGVDPEEFEKTLLDSFLEQVNGGFVLDGIIVCCPICENSEPSEIAYERLRRAFNAAESAGQMPVRTPDSVRNGENTRCAETTSVRQKNITAYGYPEVCIYL